MKRWFWTGESATFLSTLIVAAAPAGVFLLILYTQPRPWVRGVLVLTGFGAIAGGVLLAYAERKVRGAKRAPAVPSNAEHRSPK